MREGKVEEKEIKQVSEEIESHNLADEEENHHNDKEKNKKHHSQSQSSNPPQPTVASFSPPTPPSLRGRKPPSPPLHSSSNSSFSDDHCSPYHDLSPPPEKPPSSVAISHRSLQLEPKVVTKVDPVAQEGFVGVGDLVEPTATSTASGGGGGVDSNRRLRTNVSNLLRWRRESKLKKTLWALRVSGMVLCLISFSVMAADRRQGWALDSYYVYKEFKYCLAVNAIGFAYSVLQICDIANYLIAGKNIIQHQLRSYFDFYMDQILTYLLMSASSSAATRVYDWQSNWGKDKCPDMANASVALSFSAFFVFASTSCITGYTIFKLT